MDHAVGIIMALPYEAYALFGRSGWTVLRGFQTKVAHSGDLTIYALISGVGSERAKEAVSCVLESSPFLI